MRGLKSYFSLRKIVIFVGFRMNFQYYTAGDLKGNRKLSYYQYKEVSALKIQGANVGKFNSQQKMESDQKIAD